MSKSELIEGRWYWVTSGDETWWLAKRDEVSAGGWTNEDTWEDWDGKVTGWVLVALPLKSMESTLKKVRALTNGQIIAGSVTGGVISILTGADSYLAISYVVGVIFAIVLRAVKL